MTDESHDQQSVKLSAWDVVAVLWRVPLAAASFVYFRVNRSLLTALRRAHFKKRESPEWLLMPEVLAKPLAMPIVMVTGPRWNTHAIIATAGPVHVPGSFAIDVAAAHESAGLWTLVIYSAAQTETMASVDSQSCANQERCIVQLPEGKYSFILRYYDANRNIRLPRVHVDDRPIIAERRIDAADNRYLGELRNRTSFHFLALHYYVYVMLKYRDVLPTAFVRAEFLPVGNPETDFVYGALDRGESLSIRCAPALLSSHRVYATLYNRASFPVCWFAVDAAGDVASPAAGAGFYLLRLHPMSGTPHVPVPRRFITVRASRSPDQSVRAISKTL